MHDAINDDPIDLWSIVVVRYLLLVACLQQSSACVGVRAFRDAVEVKTPQIAAILDCLVEALHVIDFVRGHELVYEQA